MDKREDTQEQKGIQEESLGGSPKRLPEASPPLKTWVYTLRKEEGDWLAQVVLTSDGMFAAVSDYGNFSYAWRAFGAKEGRDFRDFLSGLGPDYFSSKMMGGACYAFGVSRKNEHACDRFTMQVLPILKDTLKADLGREASAEASVAAPTSPSNPHPQREG